jgi:signal transduction histidine kinase
MQGHGRFYNGSVLLPWRRLLRLASLGVLVVLVVLAAGWLTRHALFGGAPADARVRVERDVRAAFDSMATGLRAVAVGLSDAELIQLAETGDVVALRRLFSASAGAITDAEDVSVTVYGPEGHILAWAGRPSELGPATLRKQETWFLTQGPLDLRLVYVQPVNLATTRVGTVTVERPVPLLPGEGFRFPTRLAPVTLQLVFEGPPTTDDAASFAVASPSGEPLLIATLSPTDVDDGRQRWLRATTSIALMALAVGLALLAGPLLDWRNSARRAPAYASATLAVAGVVIATRLVLRLASPADWLSSPLFSGEAYASSLLPSLLGSPFHFLSTALSAAALVALLSYAIEASRVAYRRSRRPVHTPAALASYVACQLVAGAAVALILLAHRAFVQDTIDNATIDVLQLALSPFDAARLALQIGLVVAHATAAGLAVALLRLARNAWRLPRDQWTVRLLTIAAWLLPLAIWQLAFDSTPATQAPLLVSMAVVIGLALTGSGLIARYRHGSQAFRLTMLALALMIPAVGFYPTVFEIARRETAQLVETTYADEAINQRQTVLTQLRASLDELRDSDALSEILADPAPPESDRAADPAFQVWQGTSLSSQLQGSFPGRSRAPVTSSIEIYAADRSLLSRFAFNLPEELTQAPVSDEQTCDWEVYEEVAPFFAEERRILHAGRLVCQPDGRPPLGSVVVHATLDYENLSFLSSRSPYIELMRGEPLPRDQRLAGMDVEYVVYGWSRRPIYQSSDTAWRLTDDAFARIEQDRNPRWEELRRGDENYSVYLLNDRFGIYALGIPLVSPLGHAVNLAELTVLAVVTYALVLLAHAVFGLFSRRVATAPALLREVRASFYRKLFLAFVAAVFIPVVALALVTRNYVADQMRASIEQEAVRTASAARRVVEDLVAPRAAAEGLDVSDNLMVWVSRLIDQDVNVYRGARLLATSERNLFASGVLPTRTPDEAYDALELRREAATVTTEQVGASEHLVAATPLALRQLDQSILSVPLASRQREIDQQIDNLDRRVLLFVMLFMIAGSGLGLKIAERISDPVSRLTRATRRIASGAFDTQVAATSSDELRRLVEDFNSMARDLQRQRLELERTHRVEAWAEMARQVAHDIKNPLTPIQLNAEHLRRVHADRGKPMSPVLEECVETILTQVRLLRQIASEFSNFASSPTARPAVVDTVALLRDIIEPYRPGLEQRIRFDIDVPGDLPPVFVDRALMTRAITNIVENALHAMPGAGTFQVAARSHDGGVTIRVADTGVGMDEEALARAFEPYFSTKATGTGLGLPIAKRNVELNGGTIAVTSVRDQGTTVVITLPVDSSSRA